jgi:hypothetical protein
MSDPAPTLAACRTEIEVLHAFFVAWYTGETGSFERMARPSRRNSRW